MLQSTKNIPFYIISAELETRTKQENKERTERLKHFLDFHGVSYKKVIGSYQGTLETSFLIKADIDTAELAPFLANHFEQESVLFSDKHRNVSLLFTGEKNTIFPKSAYIGKLHSTTIQRAIDSLEAFTLTGNKAYYVK